MGIIFKKGVMYGGVTDWSMVNNRPDYGTGLSHEDYTSAEKTKLSDLPTATELDADLDTKVDKVTGKQLSTEDYTSAEKTKLGALPDAATLNADLASKADDSVVVKSVNGKTPTNGAVEVTAEDIPADGIGDKSVSGNPITIEDGMASVAKELSVTLEPIQDLHGYESPWIGTDTDKAPYLFRAVAESSVQDKGTHELDKLVGGTVAWNQLVQNGNFVDASAWTPVDSNYSVAGNVATFIASAQDGGIIANGVARVKGHRYLSLVDVKGVSSFVTSVLYSFGIESSKNVNITTNWSTVCQIMTAVSSSPGNAMKLRDHRTSGWDTIYIRNAMVFDLTQMFGSAIADYIYSLEQSTAGAGVAWFRRLFPAPYYPFNSGQLMSVKTSAHVMRGFNQWDEEWEPGRYDTTTGEPVATTNQIRSKNYIPVIGGQSYYAKATPFVWMSFYDGNKDILTGDFLDGYSKAGNTRGIGAGNALFEVPKGCEYIRFYCQPEYGTTYNNDICINISKTTGTPKNGDYVAYDAHSYALDSDLELRGIPKLDSNNKLYYDGDIYESSGNVQRKYGVVDLGTLTWDKQVIENGVINFRAQFDSLKTAEWSQVANIICPKYRTVTSQAITYGTGSDKTIASRDPSLAGLRVRDSAYESGDAASFKTAMSGVYLVYELATPTTETADPYTSMQVIDTSGTEEYVDARTVAIPVGHESNYANICPIEGRTGTEVQRNSPNIWDEEWELGSINAQGVENPTADAIRSKNYNRLRMGENLYGFIGKTNINLLLAFYDAQKEFILRRDFTNRQNNVPDNAEYFRITTGAGYGTTYNHDISINYPSTETAYHAHSEDTASVTFGQTVYGGQVDFVSGKCRVTHGFDSYVFENVNTKDGWDSITMHLSKTTTGSGSSTGKKCNWTSEYAWSGAAYNKTHFFLEGELGSIYVPENTMRGETIQVVYPFATPIELTLTPAQLTLLQGTNILTADGTINLTYLGSMASNVQDEIDEFESGLNNVIGSIAFIENTTAKTSHAVGDYVILNGIFCKVIASISSGETLSFGTNIQATTIGAELRAIWAQISN